MATLLARVPLTATADVLLVATAQGAGPAGWRLGFLGSSWTGSVVLKANMAAPGQAQSLTSIPFITESTGATNNAGTAITATGTYVVQPGYCVYDLYAVYTHTSGSAIVTVQTQDGATASGDLTAANLDGSGSQNTFGSNVPYTGAYIFPGALAITGALTGVTQATFSTKIVSSTALATPSALAATALNAFASTVSGAVLMGYGTTNDVSLMNRAGTVCLGVGPNTTAINIPGTLAVTGNVGIGGTINAGIALHLFGSVTATNASQIGVNSDLTYSTAATTAMLGMQSRVRTPAGAYTVADVYGLYIPDTIRGAGSAITRQYGLYIYDQTNASTNYAIYTGTGLVRFGGATTSVGDLTVGASTFVVTAATGAVAMTGALTGATSVISASPTGGLGYGTGAGGAQTQATNKQTGVTSNTITTAITLNAENLAAATITAFTFTNSAIAATDTVLVTHESAGTSGAYSVNAFPAAGSAVISLRNNTAGGLAEAIVLRVTVIKSVSA